MGFMCRDVVENIMGYIDDELDYKTLRELENHVDKCPECRAFVDTYRRMLKLSGKLKTKSFVSLDIRQRLKIILKSKMELRISD